MSDDRLDETLDQLHRNAVWRAEKGDWSQLELLLGEGRTRPSGIHLTQAECKILHEILRGERKRPRGRPWGWEDADNKAFEICEFLSSNVRGMATKAAVEVAMQHFGVGRTTVYAAIKRLGFLFSLPVQSR